MGRGRGAIRAWRARRSWMHWLALGILPALTWLLIVQRPATASSLAPRTGLHVVPFPGTPAAPPGSPVIFSSLTPSAFRSVTVTGSRTGRHLGRLERLPAGAGTAFVPRRPFGAGESVRVSASLRSRAAAESSGQSQGDELSFSFGIAVPAAVRSHPRASARPRIAGQAGTRSFHSAPGLNPPAVAVSADPDTESGDMFLTPGPSDGAGLMILNAQGRLVWFDPLAPLKTDNLAVQSYQGHPVLTWWQGYPAEDVIADQSYNVVATVKAVGYGTDIHDFYISPQGTAWLVGVKGVTADLSGVGGSTTGQLHDDVIQEVDIKTGQLLWQWDCYGHVPLDASHVPVPTDGSAWDAFHLNSLQVLPDGNLLISLRHTWSVYKISTQTGQILWTLGGRYNQFNLGPGTQFEWQHDARLTDSTLSLFDDGASPYGQEEPQSSAKELGLDFGGMRVRLIRRYTHNPPLSAFAMGSMQSLPNGDVFVGWGTEPYFSEYTPSGRQTFSGSFSLANHSYRAYRSAWSAHPLTPPDVAASAVSQGRTSVWASWNGATNVASWRVLGGASPNALKVLAVAPDHGFETYIRLSSQPAYVEVQAVGAHGRLLGTSSAQAVT